MRRLIGLAALTIAVTAPAPASAAACRVPKGADVRVRSADAVVYELERAAVPTEHVVRACWKASGRVTSLAGWDEDQYRSSPVTHFRLAGRYVAYASRSIDRLGAVYLVAARADLSRRRRLAPLEMVSLGPINAEEHRVSMVRLRLDPRGRLAASARANGTGTVRVRDATGARPLDEGPDVAAGSLELSRGVVSWTRGHALKTHRLR